jgi:hypothetical protein
VLGICRLTLTDQEFVCCQGLTVEVVSIMLLKILKYVILCMLLESLRVHGRFKKCYLLPVIDFE